MADGGREWQAAMVTKVEAEAVVGAGVAVATEAAKAVAVVVEAAFVRPRRHRATPLLVVAMPTLELVAARLTNAAVSFLSNNVIKGADRLGAHEAALSPLGVQCRGARQGTGGEHGAMVIWRRNGLGGRDTEIAFRRAVCLARSHAGGGRARAYNSRANR